MVEILSGYKSYLLPIKSMPTVGATDVPNLFNQSGFLNSRDKNFHRFYNMLMKTQMFTQFINERSFVSETNAALGMNFISHNISKTYFFLFHKIIKKP